MMRLAGDGFISSSVDCPSLVMGNCIRRLVEAGYHMIQRLFFVHRQSRRHTWCGKIHILDDWWHVIHGIQQAAQHYSTLLWASCLWPHHNGSRLSRASQLGKGLILIILNADVAGFLRKDCSFGMSGCNRAR